MNGGVRWALDLTSWKPNKTELLRALSGIQCEELARIERFVYRRDALSSLAGRLLSRAYCSRVTGLPWNRICLGRDDNNKPFMTDYHQVKFNVSHQSKFVVLAGEKGDLKLGIDVMKQEYTGGKPLVEFFRLMNKNFSSYEWSTIRSNPDQRSQIDNFFRLWTLKESFVKATGTGITVPLDQISFNIGTSSLPKEKFTTDTQVYLNGSLQREWIFQEIALDDEHCASIALQGLTKQSDLPTKFSIISLDEILVDCLPLSSVGQQTVDDFISKPYSP